MENKKIRWGIVGPGNIANKFAKAVKNVDCAELTAVYARSEEKGKEFAEKYNIENVFTDCEKMIEADVIDAVYIATPHPFHTQYAETFLNAKISVLCEKPICINAAQAIKLKDCAEKNNVFLMEAMWTRFLPAIKEAKAMVERKEIGDVLGLTADFCYSLTPSEAPRIYLPETGGGSLLDVGVYGLHFAELFLGDEPESVNQATQIVSGVDGHISILLKYKSGAIANVSSAINLYKPESAYIYGTKGYIHIPRFYGANEMFVYIGDEEKHISLPSIGDGFEEEIYEACSCIKSGKIQSDILPMSKSIKLLQQMDEIRKQNGVRYPFEGEDF